MRIGLFGGSFNPIHNGHLNLAAEAKKRLNLDKVIFIPAYIPPHKSPDKLIDSEDRFNMVRLAIESKEGFEVSRYEIDKKTKSYTIDTVKYLKQLYPEDTEFFFLIGADSLGELSTWKNIDELLKMCKFIACNRPSFSLDAGYPNVERLDIAPVDASSTLIRKMVKEKKDILTLVPKAVAGYIKRRNLYK